MVSCVKFWTHFLILEQIGTACKLYDNIFSSVIYNGVA